MHGNRWAHGLVTCLVMAAAVPLAAPHASASDDVPAPGRRLPHFRLFLKDGRTLVSFGEYVRIDGRVVFSMPTTSAVADPQLHLVDLAADRIDWDRTAAYTESVRARRYLETSADAEFALLTGDIAQALNDIGLTDQPQERLTIVSRARRALAEWPAAHYNHKQAEVRALLITLDEAIDGLRVAAGGDRFALSLVSSSSPRPAPDLVPLLAPPTEQDAIEQALTVARISDVPAERTSLLTVILAAVNRHLPELPTAWVRTIRATATAMLDREQRTDRSYAALTAEMLALATTRARAADVAGVEQVVDLVSRRDAALGAARPDALNGLLAAVHEQLDAARRLRLERDRYAIRLPELRAYRDAVSPLVSRLVRLGPVLDDIKAMTGSGPDAIGAILKATGDVQTGMSGLTPPVEFGDLHTLLLSATRMAETAARLRREAALTTDLDQARNASSAAAGALMLSARAVHELQAALRLPQSPR